MNTTDARKLLEHELNYDGSIEGVMDIIADIVSAASMDSNIRNEWLDYSIVKE